MLQKLNIINNKYYSIFTISIGKFLMGVFFSINSIALVFFNEKFDIQFTSLSFVFIIYSISNIISNFFTGYFSYKTDKKILNITILFLFGIFCILLSLVNSYFLFLSLYFITGLITGTINTTTDTMASEIIKENRVFGLNISFLYHSVGSICGPILFNLLYGFTNDFRKVYLSITFFSLAAIILISLINYPDITYKKIDFNQIKKIFHKKTLTLFFIYDIALGSQYAFTIWMPMILNKEIGIETRISNLIYTLFLVSIALGRFLSSLISRKIKPSILIQSQSALSFILFLSLIVIGNLYAIIIIYIFIGLFIGGMLPSMAAYITSKYKDYSGPIIGFLYASGFVGMIIIATLISIAGDLFSLIKVIPFLFIPYLFINLYFIIINSTHIKDKLNKYIFINRS